MQSILHGDLQTEKLEVDMHIFNSLSGRPPQNGDQMHGGMTRGLNQ